MENTTTKTAKITFCGGTGSVTGSNFLLEVEGKSILIDCGLVQGMKMADDTNWDPFLYDSSKVDFLFITHAHVDHVGRIPKLIHCVLEITNLLRRCYAGAQFCSGSRKIF